MTQKNESILFPLVIGKFGSALCCGHPFIIRSSRADPQHRTQQYSMNYKQSEQIPYGHSTAYISKTVQHSTSNAMKTEENRLKHGQTDTLQYGCWWCYIIQMN